MARILRVAPPFYERRLRILKGYDQAFLVLAAYMCLVFLVGGSARGDIVSLQLLRPVSVLVLAWSLAKLDRDHLAASFPSLCLLGAAAVLVLAQLIPLPPAIWHGLPGREIVIEIDRAAGLGDLWRPLSLDPPATRNTLGSLLVPAAVAAAVARIRPESHRRLVTLLVTLTMASAAIALLQLVGGAGGPLYFYESDSATADGLFANRNHQALLLAMFFPLLLLWTAPTPASVQGVRRRFGMPRLWLAAALAAFAALLILVTGSRAGLLLELVALIACPLLLPVRSPQALARQAGEPDRWRFRYLFVALISMIVVAAILLDRDLALTRMLGSDPAEESRALVLPTVLHMAGLYGLLGCGYGAFARVFLIHEPDALLAPSLWNHAHNDWLELVLTGGLPALLLLLVLVVAAFRAAYRAFALRATGSFEARLALLGAIYLLLFGLASLADYPLRVPIHSALFALSLVWLLRQPTRSA